MGGGGGIENALFLGNGTVNPKGPGIDADDGTLPAALLVVVDSHQCGKGPAAFTCSSLTISPIWNPIRLRFSLLRSLKPRSVRCSSILPIFAFSFFSSSLVCLSSS